MKLLFVFCTLILFISCNSGLTKDEKSKEKLLTEFKTTDNNNIIGSWTMCSYFCGGYMTQMNVCLTIIFNYNGTGFVRHNNTNSENFIWTLKKGQLSISHVTKDLNHTFADTTFATRFGERKEERLLTIIHQTQECSYYLSK